jgi:maltose O-acetyltransferase
MVKIGSYVFIAHEVVIADHFAAVPPPDNQVPSPRSASIVVGDNTWIGARAVLLSGARIGEGSIVGAGSVVDFEVEPFSVVAGNPARVVRRLR